tara:strand:- start:2996 stop:3940 length:945 start_codon:yes stop_codon:yes gene_type:complete
MENTAKIQNLKFYLLLLISGIIFSLFSCEKNEMTMSREELLNYSSEANLKKIDLSSKSDKMYPIFDSNFELALIEKGLDDHLDGQVLKETVLSITELDISASGISSLNGIEYFVNLIKLNCNNNNLTTLDLGKNKALEELTCNTNQLEFLDVRKNKDLKVLHCNTNRLQSLDLRKNTLLERLFCNHNLLESIDLSENKMLIELYLNNNKLTSLDLSENSVLERLLCNKNNLESLDVSNNNSLLFFRCNNNNISCIQVNQEQLDNIPSGWPGGHGEGEAPDDGGEHDDGGHDDGGHDDGGDDGNTQFIYSLNCNE